MKSCTEEGLSHYEVVSPEMESGGYYGPIEVGRCWGVYLVRTRRDARHAAVKDPEFREWVTEARGDNSPPFKGLKVRPARCDHNVCWGCPGNEDGEGCLQCFSPEEPDWVEEL